MVVTRTGLIVGVCAITLGACASLPDDESASIARGRALARQVCASCHAVTRNDPQPRSDARPLWNRGLRHTALIEGRLEQLTSQGHYAMPKISLARNEIRDLTAYIASLESADKTPPPASP